MFATGMHTLEWAATLTRKDADVFRFVSGTRSVELGGEDFTSAPGFNVSSITCTLGYSVDTLETTVLETDDLTRADFLAGRWNQSRVDFDQYNWKVPADGVIPWPSYEISRVNPLPHGFKLEFRDLRQYLRQDFTYSPTKTCGNRLGDGKCGKDLTAFTHTGVVTSVQSRSQFTCSGLAQAADYFTNGTATFPDGLYAGLPLLIREHTAGGVIKLAVPLIADVVVDQEPVLVAGCLKRFDEDCKTKFANQLNFRGNPHQPKAEELIGG
jgi:uncharacterized phage protein (TIGR02218 family)